MHDTPPSDARLRRALRAARQGFWEVDLRTGVAHRSPELQALLGPDRDVPGPLERLAHVHEEDQPLVRETYAQLGAGALDEAVVQYRYAPPDGPVLWVEQHAFVERGALGTPVTLYGLSRDVTRRKRTERDLQELNATLEVQVRERNAALDAFVAFTEAVGSETDVQAVAQQAIHVLRSRFEGVSVGYYEQDGDVWKGRVGSGNSPKPLSDTIAAGLPSSTPLIARMLRERAPVFVEGWDADREGLVHSDVYGAVAGVPLVVNGDLRRFLGVALLDAPRWTARDQALVVAVGRGLTLALERAEQARQLDEEREALAAFTAFTEAVGTETDVLTLMRRAMHLLGDVRALDATYFERDGERFTIRLWPQDFPEALLARSRLGFTLDFPDVAQAARERQVVFTDGWNAPPRGVPESAVYGAVAHQPFFQGDAMTAVLVVGSRGATRWTERDRGVIRAVGRALTLALERAEQARQLLEQRDVLRERTRALEVANEELEAFTYSVSHDLRTPVRHIVAFNGLLRAALPAELDEKAARYLQVVNTAAQRMNVLIDAMLDLSRTSRLPLRLMPVDLGALVSEAREALSSEVGDRVVTWAVADLPSVTGDANSLRQVLVNLLANAVKYTRTRDAAVIEVWAEARTDAWVMHVRDNGVGFDPRYQERLFGVFQRLHRAEEFEGTGVGLANVRRIIERHGGRVWAEGQVGKGATFSFTLPKRP